MKLAQFAVLVASAATSASAQTNLGAQKPEASLPFVMTKVATFNLPWRLAFLRDGRVLTPRRWVRSGWSPRPVKRRRPMYRLCGSGTGRDVGHLPVAPLHGRSLRLPQLCRARRRRLQLGAGTGKARAR
jgi:hypothetical protein